jgi:hypothetical protein
MRTYMKAIVAVIGLVTAVLVLVTAWIQFNKEVQSPGAVVAVALPASISVELPGDLTCQQHSSGYCGLSMKVTWSGVNDSVGYYLYTIGHGLNYQPEIWWVAGNGIPITTNSGQWTINDSAYGHRGDSLGVFACLTKQKYRFDGVGEIKFPERPLCEIYSKELIFQPK